MSLLFGDVKIKDHKRYVFLKLSLMLDNKIDKDSESMTANSAEVCDNVETERSALNFSYSRATQFNFFLVPNILSRHTHGTNIIDTSLLLFSNGYVRILRVRECSNTQQIGSILFQFVAALDS